MKQIWLSNSKIDFTTVSEENISNVKGMENASISALVEKRAALLEKWIMITVIITLLKVVKSLL